MHIRIDNTTLTQKQYKALVKLLVTLGAMKDSARSIVVQMLPTHVSSAIEPGKNQLEHVISIWDTCSKHHVLRDLLGAIDLLEQQSPSFQRLQDMFNDLTDFVTRNAPYLERYEKLAEILSHADENLLARWLDQARTLVPVSWDFVMVTQPIRDLLLMLGELPASPDGSSFPLFIFVDGVLGEMLNDMTLEDARTKLTSIATEHGVTAEGLSRLQATVHNIRFQRETGGAVPAGVTPRDPSFLIVIEPKDEKTGAPPYRLHFYQWAPWEAEELVRASGTTGRRLCMREPSAYLPIESLQREIGAILGQWLRETRFVCPLVEFVVPARLLCEPFEQINVDLLGDTPGLESKPELLGVVARVIVRSWERTRKQFPPALHEQWRRRWRHVNPTTLRVCWLGSNNDAFALLRETHNQEASCLGVAFVPVCPAASQKILRGLLAGGVPIALWRRDDWRTGDASPFCKALADIINSPEPQDLRDRVLDQRAKAVNATVRPHIGECLTLFWDDPDRMPPLGEGKPSPLR